METSTISQELKQRYAIRIENGAERISGQSTWLYRQIWILEAPVKPINAWMKRIWHHGC